MKDFIEQEYNLKIEKLINNNDYYEFVLNNIVYIFKKIRKELLDEKVFPLICAYFNVYTNMYGSYFTKIGDDIYILYSLKDKDILHSIFNNKTLFSGYSYNVSKIWENKIEGYYELLKIGSLNECTPLLHFFIGIVENLISVYNFVVMNNNSIRVCLNHSRINVNNDNSFFDIDNILVDHIGRDIAEYVKESGLSEEDNYKIVLEYINEFNMDSSEINLLLIRILYPTFYFDLVDDIDNAKYDEISIMNIFEKNLELYKRLVLNLKKTNFIYEISWLL